MGELAVRAEGIGKRYRIGELEKRLSHGSLRETLSSVVAAPFRDMRKRGRTNQDTIWALKDVSFDVRRGEVVGIIGRNGAGKSTLLKVLSRITEPTEGQVEVRGRVSSLLEVGTGFHQELTGRENVYLNGAILGMRRAEIDRRFDEIVAFAGVEQFIDTPVKRYSSGMGMRLAYAVAAHLEPEIMLVDEVLAVGDAAFQEKCFGHMRQVASGGRTVLLVSHNMSAIRTMCSRAILLESGQIAECGDTEPVIEHYLSMVRAEAADGVIKRGDGPVSGVSIVRFLARAAGTVNSPPQTCVGAEFVIGYEAEKDKPIHRLEVRLTIANSRGTNVFTVSTRMTRSHFYEPPRIGEILCSIEKLPLIPGEYSAEIRLIDDWYNKVIFTDVGTFRVIDSGASGLTEFDHVTKGSVAVPHEWAIAEADVPAV